MAEKGIIIDVGFASNDLEDYLNKVKKEFEKVDFAEAIGLEDAFKEQAKTIRAELSKLEDEIKRSAGGKSVEGLEGQYKDLSKTVSGLVGIVKEVGKAIPNINTSSLDRMIEEGKELNETLTQTGRAVSDISKIAKGNNTEITVVSDDTLSSLKSVEKELKDILYASEKVDSYFNKQGHSPYKNTKEDIKEITDSIQRFGNEYLSITRRMDNEDLSDEQFDQLNKRLLEVTSNLVRWSNTYTKVTGKQLTTKGLNFDDVKMSMEDALDSVTEYLERIQSRLAELGDTDIINKKVQEKIGRKQLTVPLDISENAVKRLAQKSIQAIETVQNTIIDSNPLQVRIDLVSGYKTKKGTELLEQLTADLENIDDSEIKDRIGNLLDDINKYIGNELHLKVELEGSERVSQKVKDLIADLQEKFEEPGLFTIQPKIELTEENQKALQQQIDALGDKYDIELSVNDDEEKSVGTEVKSLGALLSRLQKITDAIDAKTDAFLVEEELVTNSVMHEREVLNGLYADLLLISDELEIIVSSVSNFQVDKNFVSAIKNVKAILKGLTDNTSTTPLSEMVATQELSDEEQLLKRINSLWEEINKHRKVKTGEIDSKSNIARLEQLAELLYQLDKIGGKASFNYREGKNDRNIVADYYRRYKESVSEVTDQLSKDDSIPPIAVDVEPVISSPQGFADKVTKQLNGVKAKIDVEVDNVAFDENKAQTSNKRKKNVKSTGIDSYFNIQPDNVNTFAWEELSKNNIKNNLYSLDYLRNASFLSNDGLSNKGILYDNDKIIIKRENQKYSNGKTSVDYKNELASKLDEAYKSGVDCARILSIIEDKEQDVFYEIQEVAKGQTFDSFLKDNENIKISDEQVLKLLKDLKTLHELDVQMDFVGNNLFYDKNSGFNLIDLQMLPGLNSDNETYEKIVYSLLNSLLSYQQRFEELGNTYAIKLLEGVSDSIVINAKSIDSSLFSAVNQSDKNGLSSGNKIEEDKNAAKELVTIIQSSGKTTREFFDGLNNGSVKLSENLNKILSQLNLIKDGKVDQSKIISSGSQNLGGFVSGNITMIQRDTSKEMFELADSRLLEELYRDGVQVNRIFEEIIGKEHQIFQIQETVNGDDLSLGGLNPKVLELSNEQLKQFIVNLDLIRSKGGSVDDGNLGNFKINSNGIGFIDLAMSGNEDEYFGIDNTLSSFLYTVTSKFQKKTEEEKKVIVEFIKRIEQICKENGYIDTSKYDDLDEEGLFDFNKFYRKAIPNKSDISTDTAIFSKGEELLEKYGRNTIEGYVNGSDEERAKLVEEYSELASVPIEIFKEILGIASPSKVFRQLGVFTAEGYLIGFKVSMEEVKQAVAADMLELVNSGKDGAKEWINAIDSTVSSEAQELKYTLKGITQEMSTTLPPINPFKKMKKADIESVIGKAGSTEWQKAIDRGLIAQEKKGSPYYANEEALRSLAEELKNTKVSEENFEQSLESGQNESRETSEFFDIVTVNLSEQSEEFKRAAEAARFYCSELGEIASITRTSGTYNTYDKEKGETEKHQKISYRVVDVNGNNKTFDPQGNIIGEKDAINILGQYKEVEKILDVILKLQTKVLNGSATARDISDLEKARQDLLIADQKLNQLEEQGLVIASEREELERRRIANNQTISELSSRIENNSQAQKEEEKQNKEREQVYNETYKIQERLQKLEDDKANRIERNNQLLKDQERILDKIEYNAISGENRIVDPNELNILQKYIGSIRSTINNLIGTDFEVQDFNQVKNEIKDLDVLMSRTKTENKLQANELLLAYQNVANEYKDVQSRIAKGNMFGNDIDNAEHLRESLQIIKDTINRSGLNGDVKFMSSLDRIDSNLARTFDKLDISSIQKIDKEFSKIDSNDYLSKTEQNIIAIKTDISDIISRMESGKFSLDNIADAKEWEKLYENIRNVREEMSKDENITGNEKTVNKIIRNAAKTLHDNTAMPKSLKNQYQDIINDAKRMAETFKSGGKESKDAIDKLATSLTRLDGELQDSGKTGDNFFTKVKKAVTSSSAQAFNMYFSLQDWLRYGRQVIQTITEIDTGLTELRKVSDATDQRLEQSFKNSAKTAQELGATITDVIYSTSDWARLGYNVDTAEELARVTTLYQNVGDGINQEEASESLVSTMQGFKIAYTDAEEIIDKFNEVSNNFEISSGGIGEALKRSAASFNAANTDLSESIALVTATNAVVQDPDAVGKHNCRLTQ